MQRRLSAVGIFLTCPSLCNDVHGGFWKNFFSWVALAVRTWKYGTLFLCDFVPGSLFLDVWVLPLAVPQCLARRWIHVLRQYLAVGGIAHVFHVAVDSNPEVLWSVDASVSVLVALLAPGNLEILSRVQRGLMWGALVTQVMSSCKLVSVTDCIADVMWPSRSHQATTTTFAIEGSCTMRPQQHVHMDSSLR